MWLHCHIWMYDVMLISAASQHARASSVIISTFSDFSLSWYKCIFAKYENMWTVLLPTVPTSCVCICFTTLKYFDEDSSHVNSTLQRVTEALRDPVYDQQYRCGGGPFTVVLITYSSHLCVLLNRCAMYPYQFIWSIPHFAPRLLDLSYQFLEPRGMWP